MEFCRLCYGCNDINGFFCGVLKGLCLVFEDRTLARFRAMGTCKVGYAHPCDNEGYGDNGHCDERNALIAQASCDHHGFVCKII